MSVRDIREEFAELRAAGKIHNGTLEIVGASFIADSATIFGIPNYDYIQRELQWYMSESLNVNDIPDGAPQIWQHVSDADGFINSNYGFLLYSDENHRQFDQAVEHLLQDHNSRRAVAVYTRPTIHNEWDVNGMSDFICTNAVHYLIRNGELEVVVQMRSNDAIFGYRNDYAWQRFAQGHMCQVLNSHGVPVTPGEMIWQASSLHIYERHFGLVDQFIETGDYLGQVKL
jgi:thymidylate synthase